MIEIMKNALRRMFRVPVNALRRVFRIQVMEKKLHDTLLTLNETQDVVLRHSQKVADLELHNAGMHASLINRMLKNEMLLLEIGRNIDPFEQQSAAKGPNVLQRSPNPDLLASGMTE